MKGFQIGDGSPSKGCAEGIPTLTFEGKEFIGRTFMFLENLLPIGASFQTSWGCASRRLSMIFEWSSVSSRGELLDRKSQVLVLAQFSLTISDKGRSQVGSELQNDGDVDAGTSSSVVRLCDTNV